MIFLRCYIRYLFHPLSSCFYCVQVFFYNTCIHVLHALEPTKHCMPWMKTHFSDFLCTFIGGRIKPEACVDKALRPILVASRSHVSGKDLDILLNTKDPLAPGKMSDVATLHCLTLEAMQMLDSERGSGWELIEHIRPHMTTLFSLGAKSKPLLPTYAYIWTFGFSGRKHFSRCRPTITMRLNFALQKNLALMCLPPVVPPPLLTAHA